MRIAVIGAGFCGLSAAYYLSKNPKTEVFLFEKESHPGGLAIGFENSSWEWELEKHYHHLFTSDWTIRNIAKELGHQIFFRKAKTSVFVNEKLWQLDSATSLLDFLVLSPLDRIRTGLGLGLLKLIPYFKLMDKITAENFLKRLLGESSWEVLWEPLFKNKFGTHASYVPMSWFWARVKKRSQVLGYPEGGFKALAKTISIRFQENGGAVVYDTRIESISRKNGKLVIETRNGGKYTFDRIIFTPSNFLFNKIVKKLPKLYRKALLDQQGLGALNLLLALKKGFLEDGTYWLNINEKGFPFLAVVEHTNLIKKRHYGDTHLVYVGNYLPYNHPLLEKSATQILNWFVPFLKKINPKFNKAWIKKAWIFKAPLAQPVPTLNQSEKILSMKTPIKGLYLANIQQIHPWDRGTNYAVDLGKRVAEQVSKSEY